MKGPGIFLAQFMGEAPFDRFDAACRTMADFGYTGVQVPSNDTRCMDLRRAAESQDYCDELLGTARENGVEISELSAHLQGQLVAVHPAYDHLFDGFAPPRMRGRPEARTVWAAEQMKLAAVASRRMGLTAVAAFSGALAWPFLYPWPQRPAGLIEEAFDELALRWQPILDVYDDNGIDLCFELHPGEDLHDGATFEAFLDRLGGHRRLNILYDPSHFLLQQLDYVDFIERYHERIKMFHVKDAEFRPNGRAGIYGGYLPWKERPGRFRSTGDGQVDFKRIFSALTQYGYDGWAIIEWECALKDSMQGAAEGAPFIRQHLIEPASKAFDDFAEADPATNRATLGLPNRTLAAE
jgi:sugar phosphate isomerase/epimerase